MSEEYISSESNTQKNYRTLSAWYVSLDTFISSNKLYPSPRPACPSGIGILSSFPSKSRAFTSSLSLPNRKRVMVSRINFVSTKSPAYWALRLLQQSRDSALPIVSSALQVLWFCFALREVAWLVFEFSSKCQMCCILKRTGTHHSVWVEHATSK